MRASRALWALALAAPLVAAAPTPARAQTTDSAPSVIPAVYREPLWRRPWVRPLASLLVPGTGQLLAGHDHGIVYLAAELWFVARAVALSAEGRRQRNAFITLGWDVARAQFAPERLDAPWEYYEAMSHWVESGQYSLNGNSGPLQPETDTLTYNGAMWLLARRNYLANPDSIPPSTDPAYQAAIAFYRERAFPAVLQWSWRNARLEMDTYAQTIRESDNDFRDATTYLGAILLNHLASVVDAVITLRVAGGSVVPRAVPAPAHEGFYLMWNLRF